MGGHATYCLPYDSYLSYNLLSVRYKKGDPKCWNPPDNVLPKRLKCVLKVHILIIFHCISIGEIWSILMLVISKV